MLRLFEYICESCISESRAPSLGRQVVRLPRHPLERLAERHGSMSLAAEVAIRSAKMA
jgi:hypothetical protein